MTAELIQVGMCAGQLQDSGGHGVLEAVLSGLQELLVDQVGHFGGRTTARTRLACLGGFWLFGAGSDQLVTASMASSTKPGEGPATTGAAEGLWFPAAFLTKSLGSTP